MVLYCDQILQGKIGAIFITKATILDINNFWLATNARMKSIFFYSVGPNVCLWKLIFIKL